MGGVWRNRVGEAKAVRFDLGDGAVLAPLDMGDAPSLFALVQRSRAYLSRWLPWLDRIRDMYDARELIRISKRERALGRALRFGIWQDDRLAGVITLDRINRQRRTASVGYWLDQEFQGRGLVSASVAALVRYAMEELGVGRVEISTAVDNERSRRVAERLGFRFEGVLRNREWLHGQFVDHAVYSLTPGDPLPSFSLTRAAR